MGIVEGVGPFIISAMNFSSAYLNFNWKLKSKLMRMLGWKWANFEVGFGSVDYRYYWFVIDFGFVDLYWMIGLLWFNGLILVLGLRI